MIAQTPAQDIGEDIESVNKMKLLENHRTTRSPGAQVMPSEGSDVDSLEVHCPPGRIEQAIDETEEGRFSRTGAPNNPDHLSRHDVQAHVPDRHGCPKMFTKPFQPQHRILPPARVGRSLKRMSPPCFDTVSWQSCSTPGASFSPDDIPCPVCLLRTWCAAAFGHGTAPSKRFKGGRHDYRQR